MIYVMMVVVPVFGAMVCLALWDAQGELQLSLAERRNPFFDRLRSRLRIGAANDTAVPADNPPGFDEAA